MNQCTGLVYDGTSHKIFRCDQNTMLTTDKSKCDVVTYRTGSKTYETGMFRPLVQSKFCYFHTKEANHLFNYDGGKNK